MLWLKVMRDHLDYTNPQLAPALGRSLAWVKKEEALRSGSQRMNRFCEAVRVRARLPNPSLTRALWSAFWRPVSSPLTT